MKLSCFLIAMFLSQMKAFAAEPLKVTMQAPKNIPPPSLLVVLHGCDQSAKEFFDLTSLKEKAVGKAVLLVEQNRKNNAIGCFNWFSTDNANLAQNSEAAQITEAIKAAEQKFQTKKTFILGLSAGGAMTGLVATCYENIRAAAIHSAPSYLRANNLTTAVKLMKDGPAKTSPKSERCKGFAKKPLLMIQGDSDEVVHASNAKSVVEDLGTAESKFELIPKLRHAWAGGKPNFKYSEPMFPSSTDAILRFFETFNF